MSGSGAPEQSAPHARGMRVTVVAAQWHERIMGGLVAGALRAVEEAGAQASVVRAVGSFELPVLAAAAARGGATCDDEAQALARCGGPVAEEDKGYEAACAAMSTALTLAAMRG